MNNVILARYNKEDKCYDLNLEDTSFIVKVKEINTTTKEFFIQEMSKVRDISDKDTQDVIDSLRPTNIEIKFTSLYERG